MKRLLFIIGISLVWASPAHAVETIQSFDTTVVVNVDSSLSVTERVVYDMSGIPRHGLERIIPKRSEDGPTIVIRDVTARRDGASDMVNLQDSSAALTIRVGNPDVTMTGVHTYELSYTVLNEVRYFTDRDEVYWDVIPQDMRLPILESSATMELPTAATLFGSPLCYTGSTGTTESECTVDMQGARVTATALRPFNVSEGMSVAVAIRPGVIDRVAPTTDTSAFQGNYVDPLWFVPALFAVIAVFLFWARFWSFRTLLPRKRSNGGEIIVEYDPPPDCVAPEAAYLSKPGEAGRMFTSGIVELAIGGWLTMEFTRVKHWYGTRTEITFMQTKTGYPGNPALDQIQTAMFIAGPRRTLLGLKRDARLGAVPATFIGATIMPTLIRRGWLERSGMFRVFAHLTDRGRVVAEHLAGLAIYIGAAEKERLEFHNAPEHSPQTFEKLLPFAIALGVDKPWIQAFGDLQYTPQWSSGDSSLIGMVALSSSLGELSSGVGSVMNAYSSGTGGGGGGGGSSGGGGGGGGGGGW